MEFTIISSQESRPMNLQAIFSKEEIKELLSASDAKGWMAVATTWGIIFSSMAMMAFFPNILTIFFGCVLLGGRHLALAILMHEASHYSLFKRKILNDVIGQWLCAYPTWQDLQRYRVSHLKHHQFTGTPKDPDLNLVLPFPITKKSFWRKLLRDLLGVSGIKRIYGILLMDLGFIEYTTSGSIKRITEKKSLNERIRMGFMNFYGVFLTNFFLWGALYLSGHGRIYGVWVVSYLIPFSVFVRIRSIAEHACTPDLSHPFLNTRSTKANLIARLTVAPHYVNYHLEHHLLMKAPYFQLPRIHKILNKKGILEKACTANGYLEILQAAMKKEKII